MYLWPFRGSPLHPSWTRCYSSVWNSEHLERSWCRHISDVHVPPGSYLLWHNLSSQVCTARKLSQLRPVRKWMLTLSGKHYPHDLVNVLCKHHVMQSTCVFCVEGIATNCHLLYWDLMCFTMIRKILLTWMIVSALKLWQPIGYRPANVHFVCFGGVAPRTAYM